MKLVFPKIILVSISAEVILVISAMPLFHSNYFSYLIWNIFLAFLPFVWSSTLALADDKHRISKIILFLGLLLWLVIFPNAPYVLTDLIHLGEIHSIPIWYQVLLLYGSAWTGLLLSVSSLEDIEKILIRRYSKIRTSLLMCFFILVSSFGIYLGRFLRLNSWDILLHPTSILGYTSNILFHPLVNMSVYFFTFLFFVFISGSYLLWRRGLGANSTVTPGEGNAV
jgi:uncharacterized membrane protein